MIGEAPRPWTAKEDAILTRAINNRVAHRTVAERLDRTMVSVKKRVQTLRRANPQDFIRPAPVGQPPPFETDDAGHVDAILRQGGFRSGHMRWIEPKLRVWRAA